MAQGNSNNFLSIPSREGLFKTVKVERSGEDNSNSQFDDEDEEETEEDVRLIPRCSPVPRKRGSSIADETAEYMRIRFVLPNRRVSFADSTGGDLIDVRMFVPFDSDEEDDSGWEEEEARYRKAYREPTYRVWPEFQALTGTDLALSVHTNKLEVESVTSVPDESLSFEVQIRVLNISFHKSVYVRSTMDGWITHFDHPAEYVQGSHDGETDRFSVKLSFASPYLFNGAHIDFVVRYETSDGEFWANNSGKNYSVTLLQSYEEDTSQSTNADNIELRGILKPPRYRADNDYDESYDKEDGSVLADLSSIEYESMENQTSFAPIIVQPEIDIETAKNLSSSPQSARPSSTEECHLSTTDSLHGEPLPLESISSDNLPQIEEPGATDETIQSSTLHEPQSQSTLQFPEPHVQGYNVPSMPLPTVFVHHYDEYYEFEDSNKPDHSLPPQKDDFQLDVAAQVPLEVGQPSTGGSSEPPNIQEADDLKEKKDVEEIQSEIDGTEMHVLEEQCQNIEEKTETYFHMLEESEPLVSKEVNNDRRSEDVEELSLTRKSEGLQHPLEKGTQEQDVELVSLVRAETTKVVEVMLTEESTKMGGKEIDGLVASCLSPCLGVTLLGSTEEGKETQSSLIYPHAETSDHELTTMQEELVLEPREDTNYGKQTIPMSTSDHQTTQQERSELARISETSSITPDFAFNLQPSTVHSSTEEDLTSHKSFQGDKHSVAPFQTHKDSESKLPLPRERSKRSTTSKNQTEVTLEKSVIATITFFSAVVCLVVGIQEPSIFLVVVLFLLSLCF